MNPRQPPGKGPGDLRFAVDHMLVKLGTYLRILGYDAIWRTDLRTHELIVLANREGRIFLTRNTRLPHEYPAPARRQVLHPEAPTAQLAAVVAAWDLDTESGLFSRCVRCNVLLKPVRDRETLREEVHPNVFTRYRHFTTCPQCGTVFWKGSHVTNTCRKLGLPPPGTVTG